MREELAEQTKGYDAHMRDWQSKVRRGETLLRSQEAYSRRQQQEILDKEAIINNQAVALKTAAPRQNTAEKGVQAGYRAWFDNPDLCEWMLQELETQNKEEKLLTQAANSRAEEEAVKSRNYYAKCMGNQVALAIERSRSDRLRQDLDFATTELEERDKEHGAQMADMHRQLDAMGADFRKYKGDMEETPRKKVRYE